MTAQRKRAKPVDVLLLKTRNGVAYLHYIGRHPKYGDAIRVSARFDEPQPHITDRTFSDGYVTFYPVGAAVAQSLVEVVDHLPPASLPHRLRRAGARSGVRVETWIITDGTGDIVKRQLSDDELQLPIAAIWNHDLLIHRVDEGWHPTQEGRA